MVEVFCQTLILVFFLLKHLSIDGLATTLPWRSLRQANLSHEVNMSHEVNLLS